MGDAAQKQLVQSNLRLVVAWPAVMSAGGMALLDLIQEGNVGLMRRGAVRLPPRLQVPLPMPPGGIRQAISRAIADQGRTIRMPIHVLDSVNKPTRAQREMTRWAVGWAPTIDELAFELDIDPGRVTELQRIAQDTVSLETPRRRRRGRDTR